MATDFQWLLLRWCSSLLSIGARCFHCSPFFRLALLDFLLLPSFLRVFMSLLLLLPTFCCSSCCSSCYSSCPFQCERQPIFPTARPPGRPESRSKCKRQLISTTSGPPGRTGDRPKCKRQPQMQATAHILDSKTRCTKCKRRPTSPLAGAPICGNRSKRKTFFLGFSVG